MRIFLWILAIVGGLFLLLILALVGFGFVGAKKALELVEGAEAYADETIAAYGAGWDETVFVERAAPELQEELANNPGAMDQLSLMMDAQAGEFISATASECADFNFSATTDAGEVFTATCKAQGQVAKGTADFSVSVVHRAEQWRLLGFSVDIAPSGAPSSTLVAFSSASVDVPIGITAEIAGRGIVVSPMAGKISYRAAGSTPPFVGVHADAGLIEAE